MTTSQHVQASRPVRIALALGLAVTLGWGVQKWVTRPIARPAPGVEVTSATADHAYVVPLGTAARLRAGEKLKVMPSVLHAHVGQVIRVVNNDTEIADIGPFSVPPKSTMTQKLTRKGVFTGFCVLSPTGRSQLIVQ